MKESWLGSVGHLLPRLHGQTYKTPVSPYRGLFSGEQVWLGSDVCMTTESVDNCMLVNEWAWLRSRVCLLILEVDLGSVLQSEVGQKWRYGALNVCLC